MKNAVTGTEFRQVKHQEVSLRDRAQGKHDKCPPNRMHQQAPIRRSFGASLGYRKRYGRPHDEHEQRPDEIIEMQPLPAHVLELLEKLVEPGLLNELPQAQQNRRASDNPQHVEAAQGIQGYQSLDRNRPIS